MSIGLARGLLDTSTSTSQSVASTVVPTAALLSERPLMLVQQSISLRPLVGGQEFNISVQVQELPQQAYAQEGVREQGNADHETIASLVDGAVTRRSPQYQPPDEWLPMLGQDMCAGSFTYDTNAGDESACGSLCKDERHCLYYSIWATTAGQWCRLFFDCDKVLAEQRKLTLAIYQPKAVTAPVATSLLVRDVAVHSGGREDASYELFMGPSAYHCGGDAAFSGNCIGSESCEANP